MGGGEGGCFSGGDAEGYLFRAFRCYAGPGRCTALERPMLFVTTGTNEANSLTSGMASLKRVSLPVYTR